LAAEGKPVHEHDGVWWTSRGPLYCQTVNDFQVIAPGTARPARRRALVGYSHQVPPGERASRYLEFLILDEEPLRRFGIESLGRGRRNTVRRGLKDLSIRPILEINDLLDDMLRISADQAARQLSAGYANRSPEYFYQRHERWRREMRAEFERKGARWWGAWREGRLVAFITTLAVDGVLLVRTTKSETASLKHCPNDGLYFAMLADAGKRPDVVRVVNGNPLRPSLDKFKVEFGFRRVAVPYYTTPMALFSKTKALRARLAAARDWFRSLRQDESGPGEGIAARIGGGQSV
jgi:hypothetical protein